MSQLKWNNGVAKARKILNNSRFAKYEIVKIAIEICDIRFGNNKFGYNLKAFAKDIELNYETLCTWKMEYDRVVSKIGNIEYHSLAIRCTARRVTRKTAKNKVIEIYRSYVDGFRDAKKAKSYEHIKRLKSIHTYICYCQDFEEYDKGSLDEIVDMCKDIIAVAKNNKNFSEHKEKSETVKRLKAKKKGKK